MGWNAVWLTLIGEVSTQKSAGLGIGLSFVIANFGIVLGPPFFGLLVDLSKSYTWVWLFLSLCMALLVFSRSMQKGGQGRRVISVLSESQKNLDKPEGIM